MNREYVFGETQDLINDINALLASVTLDDQRTEFISRVINNITPSALGTLTIDTLNTLKEHAYYYKGQYYKHGNIINIQAAHLLMRVVCKFRSVNTPDELADYAQLTLDLFQVTANPVDLTSAIKAYTLPTIGDVGDPTRPRRILARLYLTRYCVEGNTQNLSLAFSLSNVKRDVFSIDPETHSLALVIYFRLFRNVDLHRLTINIGESPENNDKLAEFQYKYIGSKRDIEVAVVAHFKNCPLPNTIAEFWWKVRLANMYIDLGDYDNARKYLEECKRWIPRYCKEYSGIKYGITTEKCAMNNALMKVSDPRAAKEIAEDCFKNLRASIDTKPENLLNFVECLSNGQMFEEVIEICKEYLHHNPIYPEQTLEIRAVLAFAFGNKKEEGWERMMHQCFTEMKNVYGYGDIKTLRYMRQLAVMYFNTEQPEKAVTVGEECYKIMVNEWGKEHPETEYLLTLLNYAQNSCT